MARDTTSPRLVALSGSTGRTGRPLTEAGAIAEAEMEAQSLRQDMRAAAARLRLVAYSSIWTEPARKRVEREAERLEAQAAGSERVA